MDNYPNVSIIKRIKLEFRMPHPFETNIRGSAIEKLINSYQLVDIDSVSVPTTR